MRIKKEDPKKPKIKGEKYGPEQDESRTINNNNVYTACDNFFLYHHWLVSYYFVLIISRKRDLPLYFITKKGL